MRGTVSTLKPDQYRKNATHAGDEGGMALGQSNVVMRTRHVIQ